VAKTYKTYGKYVKTYAQILVANDNDIKVKDTGRKQEGEKRKQSIVQNNTN